MDCSPPGSSVHGIFQARVLELDCHSLFQGIFLILGLKAYLLHQQADSLPWSHKGSPEAEYRTQNKLSAFLKNLNFQYTFKQLNCITIKGNANKSDSSLKNITLLPHTHTHTHTPEWKSILLCGNVVLFLFFFKPPPAAFFWQEMTTASPIIPRGLTKYWNCVEQALVPKTCSWEKIIFFPITFTCWLAHFYFWHKAIAYISVII